LKEETMTDKTKPEELKDEDLDAAQGGILRDGGISKASTVFVPGRTYTAKSGDGGKPYLGETEKNIILWEESETI
jgi:hypothetical protein